MADLIITLNLQFITKYPQIHIIQFHKNQKNKFDLSYYATVSQFINSKLHFIFLLNFLFQSFYLNKMKIKLVYYFMILTHLYKINDQFYCFSIEDGLKHVHMHTL
jgi:hypothetical protein